VTMPARALVYRHHSIRPALVTSLVQDLERAGFKVDLDEQRFESQQGAEWALPSFTTLVLSAASAGGVLVFKKFADGFLEDMGVKNAGSRISQTLKNMFLAALGSDVAYSLSDRKRMARKEPRRSVEPAVQKATSPG
jgi:hypothetical protein